MNIDFAKNELSLSIKNGFFLKIKNFLEKHGVFIVAFVLSAVSIASFIFYYYLSVL